MGASSSSSGGSSKSIFLTEYIELLRQRNLLAANDFTGDHLEDIDKVARDIAILQNLPDDSKKKLQIDHIVNKIGVSLVIENNHIRYATLCTTVLKDQSQISLIVPKAPPKDTRFRIPNDGPEIHESPKIKIESKKHGFKALNEAVLISPVWELSSSSSLSSSSGKRENSVAYMYEHGIPSVGSWNTALLDKEGAAVASFSWHLTQYCVYNPESPDEIGDERFIFAGASKGNEHPLAYCYMRVEDLRRRLEKGSYAIAKMDLESIEKEDPFFPLWNWDGKLLDKATAWGKFGQIDPNATRSGAPEMAMFTYFCRLARLARINTGFNPTLARFWDQPWEQKFILQIDPKYAKIIEDRVKNIVPDKRLEGRTWDSKISDVDKRLTILIEDLKAARQFKPEIEIRWGMDDLDEARSHWSIWEQHPNELYRLWIKSSEKLSVMSKPQLALWLDHRFHLKDNDVLAEDENIKKRLASLGTYKNVVDAATTVTVVTRSKINVVRNYVRKPDQVGAMGGQSPNDLVREWWRMGKKEQGAEWLHRSAFSYGGIETGGGFNPQSSQVMSNLIIGTQEANTMMIRHEIFVKRLAHYTKEPVRVTTTLRQLFEEDLPPVAWYSPTLKYEVENRSVSIPVKYTKHFMTICRRLPTRLELDLDELFERLAYGWMDDDDDFMAE